MVSDQFLEGSNKRCVAADTDEKITYVRLYVNMLICLLEDLFRVGGGLHRRHLDAQKLTQGH